MNTILMSVLSFFSIHFGIDMSSLVQDQVRPKIALMYLSESIDLKNASASLIEIIKNDDIQGVLLVIDNKGGDCARYSVLCDLIKKITTVKPVISLVAGYALSGGYMLACSSDYIIVHTGSNIGSIGVYQRIEKHKNKKIANDEIEADVDVELFASGEFKTYWHADASQLSEKEREYVVNSVDSVYQYFLELVCANRGLPKEEYKQWAEGKEFLAHQALELGLVDEIGTIIEAESKIIELLRDRNPDLVFTYDVEYIPLGDEE